MEKKKGGTDMTIEELYRGIEEGKWTCRDLVRKCLTAIAANDSAGRKLNSVAEINADVFFEADRIDAEIKQKTADVRRCMACRCFLKTTSISVTCIQQPAPWRFRI